MSTSDAAASSVAKAESPRGRQRENILLIGNETGRARTQVDVGNTSELTATLPDVITILHLNPKADTA